MDSRSSSLRGSPAIVIAEHHWPVAGQTHVVELLKKQRDLYK
jgi:alkyl sulfatase BDS1-like metallo-beta-lactamase superfamily hydrolase